MAQPQLSTKITKLLNGQPPASGAPLGMVSKDVDLGDRLNEAAYAEIADPGSAGAIPVTSSGECAMTSSGPGEARSLANPSFIGQELSLLHAVDGGSLVITAAAAINQAGNTIITMADVNDWTLLKAVDLAAGLRWRVQANDGGALS
jgi:hypothetical protein